MFRLFLFLITVFASASAFTHSGQAQLPVRTNNTIVLNNSTYFNAPKTISLVNILTDDVLPPLQSSSKNHSQSIGFAQPVRASLLTHHLEQSPEYIFVEELLSTQLDVFADNETQLAKAPPNWFMLFSDKCSRLSGWKDSNTLYTSKVTYLVS